jgi:Beta-lactamase enzyme family/Bacterial tandem repeat domain 1
MSPSHKRAVLATVLALAGLALAYPSGTFAAVPAPIVHQPDVVTDDPILDPGLGQTASACAPIDVDELRRPYVFRRDLTPGQLQGMFDDLAPEGWRPQRLTGYQMGGSEERFATKWVRTPGPSWTARFGLTGAAFHSLYLQLRGTHRPVDVTGYNLPSGATRYAVTWERNTTGVDWRVHRDVSRDGMQDLVDQYAGTGFLPIRVEAYSLDSATRYVSIWVKDPCGWAMHNKMTRAQYQDRLEQYAGIYRLVHLDSYADGGDTYYAGIWWQRPGPGQAVRSNRDWYLFQRFHDNYACQGAVLDNVVVANVEGSVRYGGIWTSTGASNVGPGSPVAARIAQEVNCAPGRAGAAVINVTTGEQVMVGADDPYGTSSTIKSAILYALLRRIDATAATLNTQLNVGAMYGNNQTAPGGGGLTANQSYTLSELATRMIRDSNNWATNRLIDFIGMDEINDQLDDLGRTQIRLRRYMTGTGSPSAHGNSSAGADYQEGWDNTATPRQFAAFLRLVDQNNGRLDQASWNFFWSRLALNSGAHGGVLSAGVGSGWGTLAEKAGNNTWGSTPDHRPQIGAHLQRSAAGRLTLSNGETVVYSAFVDEADGYNAANPSNPNTTPLQNMLDCVVMQAVREYAGQTTGNDVAACRAG